MGFPIDICKKVINENPDQELEILVGKVIEMTSI